mmetsp:Transcript_3710/g.7696  ORF Transcript_3710/g.7696 Transcript_3710/m.7696 type:complete len:153 (+) Transcript_3710:1179-1637(+)
MALPAGVSLFCIFDCVHSGGTVVDLPFAITGTPRVVRQLEAAQVSALQPNPKYQRSQNKLAVLAQKAEVAAAAGSFRSLPMSNSFRLPSSPQLPRTASGGRGEGDGMLKRTMSMGGLKGMGGSFRRAVSALGAKSRKAKEGLEHATEREVRV